ncbi:MAG: hypothetical protein HJJLKODD_01078 [Phycisphaerae bacterium]|nr:hypothetical protein [Phycisphaerae bacterium]
MMVKQRVRKWAWMTMLLSGGMMFQLEGCNPSVSGAWLTGLETVSQTFADTLITFLFDGLGENATTTNSTNISNLLGSL